VNVNVFFTGSPHFSDVDTDIETMRLEAFFQNLGGGSQQKEELSKFSIAQFLQTEAMASGNDHQVAIVIREFVHHHEGISPLMENKVLFIFLLQRFHAKEAPPLLFS
jgi:hypothetical protein